MSHGVSIIICTHNGETRLEETLAAIANLEGNDSKELIVVDNTSSDKTSDLVNRIFEDGNIGFPAFLICEAKPGLVNARIAGIKKANFDFLLFCDDDNSLAPNYLSKGLALLHKNPKIGVLGGKGIPVLEGPKPDWFDRYQKSFAVGPQAGSDGSFDEIPSHVYGAGAFFKKQPLLQILDSGFELYLKGRTKNQLISGDDLELCWLMQLKGFEIHYHGNLEFAHRLPSTRLQMDYLIKMKTGTSLGTALLLTYRAFFTSPKASIFEFRFIYFKAKLKANLIFLKNQLWISKQVKNDERDLALAILKAQVTSFRDQQKRSKDLFLQLQQHFKSWSFTKQ